MDATIIAECEDHLFPKMKMTVRERSLYYHLLRHTRAVGKTEALFALRPLSQALRIAESSVRNSVRTMQEKGCIVIDRSRRGHAIKILLPSEIAGIVPEGEPDVPIDIDTVDFFTARAYLAAILNREDHRCFYCLKQISPDACELDHVIPTVDRRDNSYRNVVAACHECNTTKQETPARDFCRALYRKGVLSQDELENRLSAVHQLQAGGLRPEMR